MPLLLNDKGLFYCTPFVFHFVTDEGFRGSNGYLMPIYAKKRDQLIIP